MIGRFAKSFLANEDEVFPVNLDGKLQREQSQGTEVMGTKDGLDPER